MHDRRNYYRFDSLTGLRACCRERYGTDEVWTGHDGRELSLRVTQRDGRSFECLILHLEGEMTYLVRLPERDGEVTCLVRLPEPEVTAGPLVERMARRPAARTARSRRRSAPTEELAVRQPPLKPPLKPRRV